METRDALPPSTKTCSYDSSDRPVGRYCVSALTDDSVVRVATALPPPQRQHTVRWHQLAGNVLNLLALTVVVLVLLFVRFGVSVSPADLLASSRKLLDEVHVPCPR